MPAPRPHRALAELQSAGTLQRRVGVRSGKHLNNVIEQDRRLIKNRFRPMLGFKCFDTAAITVCRIELAAQIIKHQFKIAMLLGSPKTAPQIWAAVLAA